MIPREPGGNQVAAELRSQCDDEAGDDLHDPDDEHCLVGVARDQVVDLRREVDGPVDEPVQELVEPEQDRGDREPGPQQHERLKAGFESCELVVAGAAVAWETSIVVIGTSF